MGIDHQLILTQRDFDIKKYIYTPAPDGFLDKASTLSIYHRFFSNPGTTISWGWAFQGKNTVSTLNSCLLGRDQK